jgi:hypothetical protein
MRSLATDRPEAALLAAARAIPAQTERYDWSRSVRGLSRVFLGAALPSLGYCR